MSQFQPNYPPVGYAMPGMTPRDPRGPARRAGMTMIIASLIGLMCGGLFSLMGFVPRAQFDEAIKQAVQQNPQVAALPVDAVQSWARKAGTMMACICLAQIIVAIPVRRGGRGPVTVALALSALAVFSMIIIALMH